MNATRCFMKTATIREFRAHTSEFVSGKETVLLTRHGKPAAVLLPLTDPKSLPLELRRTLYLEMSAEFARKLDAKGVTEEELLSDFEEHRKSRRRR